MKLRYLFLAASCVSMALPATAQDNVSERLDQIEQELLLLQRQKTRGEVSTEPPAMDASGHAGTAQMDVRISAIEEDIRAIRGRLEEQEFERRRLAEEMDKFKRDTEFRLGDLERINAAAAPSPEKPAEKPAEKPTEKTTEKPIEKTEKSAKPKPELAVKEVSASEEKPQPATLEAPEAPAPEAGDTPRDRYNYAFRLLNQNQYEEAAKSFGDFVKKYPKDPLVGNAYYWQGETHYIRKDFAGAAELFRQGFEAMPSGAKAPDNLLKLGMSLSAMKQKKEACIVLAQVVSKYQSSAANTAKKAQAEHKRLACE